MNNPDKLSKSKTSALILSFLTVLVFTTVSATLNMLLPYLMSGDIRAVIAHPDTLADPAQAAALAGIMLAAFLMLVGIGAYWLYRFFGEAYFGVRGAWRWILFGLLFGLLSQVSIWLFPDNDVLGWVWPAVSVFAAFFAARWIMPMKRAS